MPLRGEFFGVLGFLGFGLVVGLLAQKAAADDFFRLPSYFSVQGGLGKDSYQDGAVNLGLSMPRNWQIEAGADRTATEASDGLGDAVVTKGYHLGVGTDPLRLVSGRISAEGWQLDNVTARGGRLGVVYAPGLWTFSLDWIRQEMLFENLPLLVQRDQQETVVDTGFSFRVSTMALRRWSFFIAGAVHSYDHDLSRLYEIPALILNRMPVNVLTTLTGLSKNDASFGATYLFRKWDAGFEAGRSISAVDNVRTRRFGVNGVYYLNRKWSFGLSATTYRPENAVENSSATHSATATVTFKW